MVSPQISVEDYAAFSDFLEKSSGIVLGDNKHYLVSSRLTRLMSEINVGNLNELLKRMSTDRALKQRIMDAMTTNETSWFRDNYPYEILKERLFPEFVKSKAKRIRIWSAACSSGQEPYSISMVTSEFMSTNLGALPSNGVEVVGTDISASILQQAKQGCYDKSAVMRGLSPERQKRFFKQTNDSWQVQDEIKNRITFREMNLMQSYTLLGKFDVIFCRNVLIYFSTELKRDIIHRMGQALNPNGYLILGGSESISGYSDDFELVRWKSGVIYTLKQALQRRA